MTIAKSNNKGLVSIIIPIKNPDEYILSECLKSILSQNYKNIEILIVDASDARPSILNNYNKKIVYIKQVRKNLGGGRQDALDTAKGKFILNIDSDCIADENWISEMISSFDESNLEVVVLGRSLSFSENIVTVEIQNEYDSWVNSIIFRLNDKIYSITVDGKNFGYIKSYGQKIGFDQNLMASEDTDFAVRARRKGYRIIYNEKAVVYHKHRQNIKSLIRQKIWHGTGYGQNMVKNDLDFERHLQLKTTMQLLGALALFPITLPMLLGKVLALDNESRLDYFFKNIFYWSFIYGTFKGMCMEGGIRFLLGKAKSELLLNYDDSYHKI